MIIKRVVVAVSAAIAINLAADESTKSYVSNDNKNEKGQIVKRMICESVENTLTPYRMIEFKYNDEGNVIEMKSLEWDSRYNIWVDHELTQYDYSQSPVKITVLKWDDKDKKYK